MIEEHHVDQVHYNKLTKRAQQAIGLSNSERISNTQKKVWITHPRAQMILEEFEYLFHHEREERMPNLVVVGDTNNGKTRVKARKLVAENLSKVR